MSRFLSFVVSLALLAAMGCSDDTTSSGTGQGQDTTVTLDTLDDGGLVGKDAAGDAPTPSDTLVEGDDIYLDGGFVDLHVEPDAMDTTGVDGSDASSDIGDASGDDVVALSDTVDDVTVPSDSLGDSGVPSDSSDGGAADVGGEVALEVAGDMPVDTEEVDPGPPPLFDMDMIADASTAQCTFTNHHTALKNGVLLDVWNLSYYSWESIDGELQPILIKAFAAKPAGLSGGIPGVVQAHGLGGFAEEAHATGLASLLDMYVIAYTGPGGGTEPDNTSEGLPSGYDDGYRMFDVVDDARGNWFWAHAVAGMRAVTCLGEAPEVDDTRLGFTGFSAGAVATLIVSGVDHRVDAAVPLSGTLAWDVAMESPDAWQHNLLTIAGLTTSSPEWLGMAEFIDPDNRLASTTTHILMVDGSTDEFFPLTAYDATFSAIPAGLGQTSVSANFDHGCYGISGVESAEDIEARAALHADGCQRAWFRHWFGTDSDYDCFPASPTVEVSAVGMTTAVVAQVDTSCPNLNVDNVKIWWSNDDAFLFGSVELSAQGGGVYSDLALFPLQGNTVYYVDVVYETDALLFPESFAISSKPSIPSGFVPHIRDMTSCL